MKQFIRQHITLLTILTGSATMIVHIAFLSLLPLDAFWGPDPGMKFLQTINFSYQSRAINYPGQTLDPGLRFAPFDPVFTTVYNGNFYGIYGILFVGLSSITHRLFGFAGLYALPLISLWATMFLTARLVKEVKPIAQPIMPIIVGLGSPLLFYGLSFWEHTFAVFMAIASTYLFYTAVKGKSQKRRLFAAGVVTGFGFSARPEMFIWALAVLAALVAVTSLSFRQRRIFILYFVTGFAVTLALFQLYEWLEFGFLVKSHVAQNYRPLLSTSDWWPWLQGQKNIALTMLFPTQDRTYWQIIWLAGGCLFIWNTVSPKHYPILVPLSLGLVWLAAILTIRGFQFYEGADSFAQAFPLSSLLILLGATPKHTEIDPVRQSLRRFLMCTAIFYIAVASIFAINNGFSQWGPRYLMPALPLLIIVMVDYLTGTDWQRLGNYLAYGTAISTVMLLVLSIAIQPLGVRQLYLQKVMQSEMITLIKEVPEEVVLLDWELTALVLAPIFEDKLFFAVTEEEELGAFLDMLLTNQIGQFAFVSLAILPDNNFTLRYDPAVELSDYIQATSSNHLVYKRDVIERTVYVHYQVNRYHLPIRN